VITLFLRSSCRILRYTFAVHLVGLRPQLKADPSVITAEYVQLNIDQMFLPV